MTQNMDAWHDVPASNPSNLSLPIDACLVTPPKSAKTSSSVAPAAADVGCDVCPPSCHTKWFFVIPYGTDCSARDLYNELKPTTDDDDGIEKIYRVKGGILVFW